MPSQILHFEPGPSSAQSQTSVAYASLHEDIVAGRLQPGERLKINDLAAILAVSPGAIREALSRLVPEQLVVSRVQKGFVVAPLSIEDLVDLTELRCEIEAIALRRSVLQGSDAWEASVLSAAHLLRKTQIRSPVDRSRNPEWVERHRAFHATLISACNSPRLQGLHTHLYQQSERYRSISFPRDGDRNRQGEHQALATAALDRNADLLVTLMLKHYRETTSRIIAAAKRDNGDAPANRKTSAG